MMWILVLASAAIAYSMRISLLLFAGRRRLAPAVDRALAAVGPAVIAAMLTANLMTVDDGQPAGPGQLLGVVAAIGVVAKTRNLLAGSASGAAVLALAAWVGG